MRFSIAFLICLTFLVALPLQISGTLKYRQKNLALIEDLRGKITDQKQRLGCDNPDCDLEGLFQQSAFLSDQVKKVDLLEDATLRNDTLSRARHNTDFHKTIRDLERSREFYVKLVAEGKEKRAAVHLKRLDGWAEGTVRTSGLDFFYHNGLHILPHADNRVHHRVHHRVQLWIPTKRPVWLVFAAYDERSNPLLEKAKNDWEQMRLSENAHTVRNNYPFHLEAGLFQSPNLVRWKPMRHRLSPGEHVVEALFKRYAPSDQIRGKIILDGELLLTTTVQDNQLNPVSLLFGGIKGRLHGNTFERYDESGKPVNYEATPLPTLSKVGFSEFPDTRSKRDRMQPYAGDCEFYAVLGLTDEDPDCAEFPKQ